MTFLVGLTGGIGSGKTAASNYLTRKGITIVDSDVIAREVVEPGQPTWQAICDHFGNNATLPSGALDRAWLRQQVFEKPEERQWLEQCTHPAIRALTIERLHNTTSAYAVLASPLLFESGQDTLVDRTLVIDVSENLQLQRACNRDQNNAEQIQRIIQSQISRNKRVERADDIADNSRDLPFLYQQLDAFHQDYLHLALSNSDTP